MSLQIRKSPVTFLNATLALMLALALPGCAQQAGGLLQPTPKQIISGKNTIVPSAAALSMEATNFCNAQAQVDYASLVHEGGVINLGLRVAEIRGLHAERGGAGHDRVLAADDLFRRRLHQAAALLSASGESEGEDAEQHSGRILNRAQKDCAL